MLLLDQNLSHTLVGALESSYAGSIHVRGIGLASASDDVVWTHAQQHGLMIVTKDADFHQMSLLKGHPPKVVWIRRAIARRPRSRRSSGLLERISKPSTVTQ